MKEQEMFDFEHTISFEDLIEEEGFSMEEIKELADQVEFEI